MCTKQHGQAPRLRQVIPQKVLKKRNTYKHRRLLQVFLLPSHFRELNYLPEELQSINDPEEVKEKTGENMNNTPL